MLNTVAHSFRPLLAVMLILFGIAACAPTFDETADKQLTLAQQKFDDGAAKLILAARRLEALESRQPQPSPAALQAARQAVSYQANAAWYAEVDSALNSVRLRVMASPATPASIDQRFQDLQENLNRLSSLHEAQDRLSSVAITAERSTINTLFQRLINYQLVLKSGQNPAK